MEDRLDAIFARARRNGIASRRRARRRAAETYRRDSAMLLEWGGAAIRAAVEAAAPRPGDPLATRALCRALYRDLNAAMRLPRHAATRFMRVEVLRLLFTCECALYLRQREAADARPLTTGEWLNDICRRIGSRRDL